MIVLYFKVMRWEGRQTKNLQLASYTLWTMKITPEYTRHEKSDLLVFVDLDHMRGRFLEREDTLKLFRQSMLILRGRRWIRT